MNPKNKIQPMCASCGEVPVKKHGQFCSVDCMVDDMEHEEPERD